MVSEDDHNMISGGHDEAERLPRRGGHHEGDETSKPGPGIKHKGVRLLLSSWHLGIQARQTCGGGGA